MSGGHWDYRNDDAAREIFGWNIDVNYGERGFSQSALARKINPLEDKQLSELCWDLFCLLHSYDWKVCGDNCEETYKKDVAYFKKKWLKPTPEELTRREIDNAVEEMREELYKSLGVNENCN